MKEYLKCLQYLKEINDLRLSYDYHMNLANEHIETLSIPEQFNLAVITYEHLEELKKVATEMDDYIVKKHQELKRLIGEQDYLKMSAKSMELIETIKTIEREWDDLP